MRRNVVLLAVVLALIFALVGPAQAELIAKHGSGWLERQQNLLVLHVEGTPRDMGRQHGVLLKDHIQALSKGVLDRAMAEITKEMGVPDPTPLVDMAWAQLETQVPADYKEEMAGIAEGAGIDLKTLQRVCAVVEAGEILRTCSSFCAWGKATAGGKMYQIRNLDYEMEGGLQDHCILLVAKPQGKFKFVAPSYAGFVGCISGINEKGIALGEIGAGASEAERNFSGIPMPLMLRQILETCDTAEKAAAIVKSASRTAGFNYIFGDPDHQTVRACETSSKYCAVYTDNDPAEKAAEGNMAMENVVMRADGVADAKRIAETKHMNLAQDDRYQKMGQMIKAAYGKINADEAISISKAVAMSGNLHCAVYNNSDREIWVANAIGAKRAADSPYLHFKLADLFSAQPPQ